MKKLTIGIMAVLMMFTSIAAPLNTTTGGNPTPTTTTNAADAAIANTLIARLQEIKTTDRSNMTSSEKRELRKETRHIKGQLKQLSGGVYISVGAAILIVLLLILLL